jgi:arylsulfatase A-like enzyme
MMNEVPYRKGKFDVLRDELYCLMDGDWKYVHHRRFPEESELYHLGRDPRETTNLYTTRREVAAGFRERLEVLRVFEFDRAAGGEMSEADRARLRSLGYLHEGDAEEPGTGEDGAGRK